MFQIELIHAGTRVKDSSNGKKQRKRGKKTN